ncbi:MAG: DUF6147 family protein [Tepidibacillus sp.]
MKQLKKVGILLLTAWMISGVFFTDTSLAADKTQLPPAPTEGTPSKNSNFDSMEESIEIQSTQYIKSWNTNINNLSVNIVNVSGFTDSYSTVETISVDLYLQYWDSGQGKWVDLVHVGEFKQSNTSHVAGTDDVAVSSGFYYRTRGIHYIIENGTVEETSSVSTYIYLK